MGGAPDRLPRRRSDRVGALMPHCPPRNPMKAHQKIIAAQGNLVLVDFGGHEPLLTKKQLARQIDKSERWIEYRLAEGMPSSRDRKRRRRFVLSDVQAWLEGRERRSANA